MTPELMQLQVVNTPLTVMVILFVSGNWWAVSNFGEITGTIAIEMDKGAYIHALDNGLFTLGAPHKGLFQEIWKKNSFSNEKHKCSIIQRQTVLQLKAVHYK